MSFINKVLKSCIDFLQLDCFGQTMNKDKREPDYPAELESQFLMRLPEEPAKKLRNILKTDGETLKNRLTIQVDNDMRHGEVKLDQWMMHAKIVDLPTIVESLKTIDNKSFYKTADICQMMICKEEPDQPAPEEESQIKKKKDIYKVDKKFLWPHGITPPTKNVRKRRFRKTLKKKSIEAPEIEKEVKRLLRADNEADSVTWEIIKEEDIQPSKVETCKPTHAKSEKKHKKERSRKHEAPKSLAKPESTSRVVDIFGGAVSDSDLEDNNTNVQNVDLDDSKMSAYDSRLSDAGSMHELIDLSKADNLPIEFSSLMFDDPPQGSSKPFGHHSEVPTASGLKSGELGFEDDGDFHSQDSKENMTQRIEQARMDLEELKQRKQRTQHEIAGMDNLALRQRFQDILHTLNQDIMYKEMEYQGMITLQNSEDI